MPSLTRVLASGALALLPALAQLQSGPPLPHKVVPNWAKLPEGWNFGECSGVSVDKDDNVWVFHRGKNPVLQFDKNGNLLRHFGDGLIQSSHGIKVDPEGNIWTVDVLGHRIIKFSPQGKILMVFGNPMGGAGDDTTPYAYNRPTGISFTPSGDFYVSDGYVNSRVLKYNRDGEFQTKWGRKGKGDGEFDLVHDVAIDGKGRVYVADRSNARVQVFDANGKFLTKWTDVGAPWGLHYASKEDSLYMCDGGANRIVKLNLDGQVKGVLGSFGKVPGKLDFAHHMAVDSNGNIYVVEIKNWRVQKFAR